MNSKRQRYNEIDALNFSRAKALLRSPRAYRVPVEITADQKTCLLLGTGVHSSLLEGVNIEKCFAVKPSGMNFATREGKAWKASQTKPVLTYEEMGNMVGMVTAILDNRHARDILSTCVRREDICTKEIEGVQCKGLIDAIGKAASEPAVVEIKTSVDCRAEFFAKRAVSELFHYDMQAAWYKALCGAKVSCWIVVENHPPWDVAVYFPSLDMQRSGEAKMRKALAIYKACMELDRWPGAQPDPCILNVPRWYSVESLLSLATDETKLLQDAEVPAAGS